MLPTFEKTYQQMNNAEAFANSSPGLRTISSDTLLTQGFKANPGLTLANAFSVTRFFDSSRNFRLCVKHPGAQVLFLNRFDYYSRLR